MSDTIFCGCNSDKRGNTNAVGYQDAIYGKGMRAYTEKKRVAGSRGEVRCSVCGVTHTNPKKAAEGEGKKASKGPEVKVEVPKPNVKRNKEDKNTKRR